MIWIIILQNPISPKFDVTFKCKLCHQEYPGFYALWQPKSTQHCFPMRTEKVASDNLIKELDDTNLKEELRSSQPFLVDFELERARHKSFTYTVEKHNAKMVEEKVDHFLNSSKRAAKVNLADGFILKILEDGGFRYLYTHENPTLLDWAKLVCTEDDLAKLRDFLNRTDVIELCSREKMNTKWWFYKLTNMAVFAAFLKDVPLGCRDAVLREPLLENLTINCFTFAENTRQPYKDKLCLFWAVALHLHGNQKLEIKISNCFNLFMSWKVGLSLSQFQRVLLNDIPFVEDLLLLNIHFYDVDIVKGNTISELHRWSVQKHENTVKLLRYNNHIHYESNINAVFQYFRCPNCDTFFNRAPNLKRHLTICSERVKNFYHRTYIKFGKLSLSSYTFLALSTQVNNNC